MTAPQHADAWFQKGMRHVELSWHADYHSEVVGDLEDAVSDFNQALVLCPDQVEAWI